MERADDLSCLRKQGAQSYANTYFDRKVIQPIIILGPRDMIGQMVYGPTAPTDDINSYKYI